MLTGTFHHRSGRVIALARLVLATSFLLAIWLDPSQPALLPNLAYSLLAGYVVWSGGLLALIWRNWWMDHRLALAAHMVDFAVFGGLVFFTEGYTSPFYNFFVFLLLSSAIRWSWRATALTAVTVTVLFLAAGMAALYFGSGQFELQRLLVRCSHLVVLSLLFVWFGSNQQSMRRAVPAASAEAEAGSPPIEQAVRHAARRLNAGRVLLAWSDEEEPWVNLAELDGDGYRTARAGPEEFAGLFGDPAEDSPFLFDARHGRGLRREPGDPPRLRGFAQTLDSELARRFRLDHGLVVPIRAREYSGELFALDIAGLCADDLSTAEAVAEEISVLFDQSTIVAVSEEAAVNRAKRSLARDLHDSVVQVLAGGVLRLEALKEWIKAGKDPAPEIDAVKAELSAEQLNVRSFLAGLRQGRGSMRLVDLSAGLQPVASQIRRRWSIACDVAATAPIEGPAWIEHEMHQIVREAAANAVRHGHATYLRVALRTKNGSLELMIEDNGSGVALGDAGGPAPQPWSVHERTSGLGGTLSLVSGETGCRLNISIPLEARK